MRCLPVALLLCVVALPAACAGPAVPCSAGQLDPPCGYIRPTLEIHFPSIPACPLVPSDAQRAACLLLPADGQTLHVAGTVRFWWDIARDGSYPADPQAPIVISFPPATHNPAWLKGTVDPVSYSISAAELNDPTRMQPDTSGASPRLLYVFERPINLTLTRTGSPDADGLQQIASDGGVVQYAVKAQSTPSGSYFTPSYGLTALGFRVEAPPPPPTRTAAAPVLASGLMGLVLLVARRRRLLET